MKREAVEKARRRLRVAAKALVDLVAAQSDDDFEDAWFIFLTSWKGVYTVLEQGAKESAQSRQWFGAKKAERRRTHYLQYLFVARNDEEHGLSRAIGKGTAGIIRLHNAPNAKPGEPMSFSWDPDPSGATGRMELVRQYSGRLLGPVRDRDGTTIEAPQLWNNGKPLLTPSEIAGLALEYAEQMVAEAEQLIGT